MDDTKRYGEKSSMERDVQRVKRLENRAKVLTYDRVIKSCVFCNNNVDARQAVSYSISQPNSSIM